jgi:hypothetical protein
MPEPIKLDQLLTEFLKYAPDAIVDQQYDGNIVFISNLRLAEDHATLVPFGDEEEEDS